MSDTPTVEDTQKPVEEPPVETPEEPTPQIEIKREKPADDPNQDVHRPAPIWIPLPNATED
jgi:hypothetical protein